LQSSWPIVCPGPRKASSKNGWWNHPWIPHGAWIMNRKPAPEPIVIFLSLSLSPPPSPYCMYVYIYINLFVCFLVHLLIYSFILCICVFIY
jgi:hypothetical protein